MYIPKINIIQSMSQNSIWYIEGSINVIYMVNIIGKKNTEPEVRCIKLHPTSWQSQFKQFETNLQNKNMTIIVSVRDLILQDPIAAKNALQKLSSICKLSDVYQLAALSREMVLITPFKITMAGE